VELKENTIELHLNMQNFQKNCFFLKKRFTKLIALFNSYIKQKKIKIACFVYVCVKNYKYKKFSKKVLFPFPVNPLGLN